jgi:lipopolysaccharide biosynthesis glycosyltransferase
MTTGVFISVDANMRIPLRTMLHSLQSHGVLDQVDINIFTADAVVKKDPLLRKLTTIKPIRTDLLLWNKVKTKSGHVSMAAYYSMYAFLDYGYDVNVMLDADMLCRGNIDAVINPKRTDVILGVPDPANRHRKQGHTELNSGVLVIPKCFQGQDTVDELFRIACSREIATSPVGYDQACINSWLMNHKIPNARLPVIYNCASRAFDYQDVRKVKDKLWAKARGKLHYTDIRIMHFLGKAKPWQSSYKPINLQRLWVEERSKMQETWKHLLGD